MAAVWAMEELKDANFGDERLNKRAAVLLAAVGSRPNLSIPAACGGHAETQAAYRFFDNEKVTFQKMLEPHNSAADNLNSVALTIAACRSVETHLPQVPGKVRRLKL